MGLLFQLAEALMAAGHVDSAKRNVMRIALHALQALPLSWIAIDTDQGLSGWIEGY
jgi:hypothetical protein